MHGFALSKWVDQRTNGDLGIVDAAFYKALGHLEDAGAVHAEWGANGVAAALPPPEPGPSHDCGARTSQCDQRTEWDARTISAGRWC
jgi:hypothetical protein